MTDASPTTLNGDIGTPSMSQMRRDCEELGRTEPGNTQKMASLLQQMSLTYYEDVRRQAQQSFFCALAAATIGTLFFIYAAVLVMQPGQKTNANISLIAGALTQVISAINFWLYGRAARQFASFHICLERTNRFLLANTLCENLNCPIIRDEIRTELIQVVANAPMLTLDTLGVEGQPRKMATAKKPGE